MSDSHARRYYDDFSNWYERERHHGYHAMLDDLETSIIAPRCVGREVLEVGCGTGLIMERLLRAQTPPTRLAGVDFSMGMVRQADLRGHTVVQGSATALPFTDESFDVVYSVKVLAHVPDIRGALSEMTRVLRPGGTLIAELYNRHSIRYLAKRLTRPGRISEKRDESEVFTRWDTPAQASSYLPQNVELEGFYGVRVLTPWAGLLRIPLAREVFPKIERLMGSSYAGRFGGFLVMVGRKLADRLTASKRSFPC